MSPLPPALAPALLMVGWLVDWLDGLFGCGLVLEWLVVVLLMMGDNGIGIGIGMGMGMMNEYIDVLGSNVQRWTTG